MKVTITDIDRDITIDLGDKPVDELTLLPDPAIENTPTVHLKGTTIIRNGTIGTRLKLDGVPQTFTCLTAVMKATP